MFLKLLAVVMAMDVALGLQLGRLAINKSKNDLELQSSVPNRVLVSSISKASILNAEANGTKAAKVLFNRDTKGEHNYAVAREVANDQHLSHYSIEWYNPTPAEEFCVHIGGDQRWYSTYEEGNQRWPIDKNVNFKGPESFTHFRPDPSSDWRCRRVTVSGLAGLRCLRGQVWAALPQKGRQF